jgi:membrane protein implicated in regulation of membrane protease activity
MHDVAIFYALYPFWTWLAVGAALLALETATGSGYLLWPAMAAVAVAVMSLVVRLGAPLEAVVFAVLTIGLTVLARIYWPPKPRQRAHPELNDRGARLVGRYGETVGDFAAGCGRVFVDGAEWTAELDEHTDAEPAAGARVKVVEVVDGGRLKVTAA